MTLEMLGQLFGGIGLFLLGMQLLTNGLKQAAGRSLKAALEHATGSRLKGVVSGALITALVQSSSAVTVATLGFVNAGLLSLAQSVSIIYGSNIGTTMVGWLVALIGFKFKISAFALPLIGAGMVLRVSGGNSRRAHIGTAIAGFGIFFIGLDFLRASFDGLSNSVPLAELGAGPLALALFVVAGIVLTFLMQASAAVIAIALSLVHTESISLAAAAALVIGANVGTTTTALLASIGATPNAKRISAAHVLFNLLTGLVGLVLLVTLGGLLNQLDPSAFDLVALLALFHTLFNIAGVLLMWPLTDRMVAFLKKRFRTLEESEAKPRYLDSNILTTPSLAVEAINMELARVSRICSRMAREAISAERGAAERLQQQYESLNQLVSSIGEFNQELARQNLSVEISETLPISLRVARYFNEMARLAARLPEYYPVFEQLQESGIRSNVHDYQQAVVHLIDACEVRDDMAIQGYETHQMKREMEREYQHLKSGLLDQTISRQLTPADSVQLLDALSHIHRLAEQAEKASRYWSSTTPVQHRAPLLEQD
ncbi:Na/Pi cotransporter family protein [Marinobacterium sediminicola]|uniref:Phosphate:Na+ symporter n=1 Tax=Marinobacterium sediminicola TaxID=518898 RepID=A0ABY1S010_9GAMM|nr:Na/Pi symporter [Marinobacterium sediminicola]ULG69996.1 Na/Pi symporter [Marinobacterium sediminicola]SMR74450.1 phosphate:Na+ symporter [Marinobacterium sediminicola]